MKPTRKQLIAAAEELNHPLKDGGPVEFGPPINTKLSKQALAAEILRKCNGVGIDDDGNEYPNPDEGLVITDDLTEDTWRVCAAVGNEVAQEYWKEHMETINTEPEAVKDDRKIREIVEKAKTKPHQPETSIPEGTEATPTVKAIGIILSDLAKGKNSTAVEIAAAAGFSTVNYAGLIKRIALATVKVIKENNE